MKLIDRFKFAVELIFSDKELRKLHRTIKEKDNQIQDFAKEKMTMLDHIECLQSDIVKAIVDRPVDHVPNRFIRLGDANIQRVVHFPEHIDKAADICRISILHSFEHNIKLIGDTMCDLERELANHVAQQLINDKLIYVNYARGRNKGEVIVEAKILSYDARRQG